MSEEGRGGGLETCVEEGEFFVGGVTETVFFLAGTAQGEVTRGGADGSVGACDEIERAKERWGKTKDSKRDVQSNTLGKLCERSVELVGKVLDLVLRGEPASELRRSNEQALVQPRAQPHRSEATYGREFLLK